jgi:hypothetical protein
MDTLQTAGHIELDLISKVDFERERSADIDGDSEAQAAPITRFFSLFQGI